MIHIIYVQILCAPLYLVQMTHSAVLIKASAKLEPKEEGSSCNLRFLWSFLSSLPVSAVARSFFLFTNTDSSLFSSLTSHLSLFHTHQPFPFAHPLSSARLLRLSSDSPRRSKDTYAAHLAIALGLAHLCLCDTPPVALHQPSPHDHRLRFHITTASLPQLRLLTFRIGDL